MKQLFENEKIQENNPKWQQSIHRQTKLYSRPDDIRSEFYRDYGRLLHSQPYRRLKHKTQVFFATQNDHICTRMEHVQHVASVSYTIANYLGLNTELTQTIALGHDIGHAPFGHEGETRLSLIAEEALNSKFWHEKNGIFVSDSIATLPDSRGFQQNLNLTYAVRDGIISHCGEIDENGIRPRNEAVDLYAIESPGRVQPFTWEGCVVKIADKIAYLGRDIEDALELKLLTFKELLRFAKILRKFSPDITTVNNTVLMHNLVIDLCKNSSPKKGLCFSEKYFRLMKEVRSFNYEHIYLHKRITSYKEYSRIVIQAIYDFLHGYYDSDISAMLSNIHKDIKRFPLLMRYFEEWLIKYGNGNDKFRRRMKYKNEAVYDYSNPQEYYKSVIDFIAGMTDNFAIKVYNEIISF